MRWDDPVAAAGFSPVCVPAHSPGAAGHPCPREGGSRGQPHHETPTPVLNAPGTHTSPLCSSSLALLEAPASHHSQSGGVCAPVSPRQGHLLSPPPAVPHFGVPAALGSAGLKVPDTTTHLSGLCSLSWLSAGQDDMSPVTQGGVNVPRGSGRAGGCAAQLASPAVTPAHTGQGFGCGVSRVPTLRTPP